MNCPDFETIIIEIARERLMDAATRDRGLEHVRICDSCATLLGEERDLSRNLRALSAEGAADEIPERIETALLAAFRQRAAAPGPAPIVATRNYRRILAVAALALLSFGFALPGLIRGWMATSANRESPARSQTDGGFASTPAAPPAAPPTPEKSSRPSSTSRMAMNRQPDRPISNSPSGKRRRRSAETRAGRLPTGAVAGEIAPHETVTQFFPVMQGGELIPLEGGRIVRVRMPRSNLIPFGILFNQERANETIKADVLLSNDGLARAIRLVY
ncbi:MAG TPA: hypothetical protein VFS27_07280 [Blastocatellia bacterium]|jgi:hypothetical protein|nr:hypothetical protein [Blastocatellia bacterium]